MIQLPGSGRNRLVQAVILSMWFGVVCLAFGVGRGVGLRRLADVPGWIWLVVLAAMALTGWLVTLLRWGDE